MPDIDQGGAPLDRSTIQKRAISGALWTGIHTSISLPVAFVVNIVLARTLGVDGYGRLAYLTTVIAIASVIAGMGVGPALIQFGSKAHAAGNREQVRRYLSGAQGFRLLVAGPIIALAVLAFVRVEPWLMVVAIVFGVGLPALMGNSFDALTIENRTDKAAKIMILGNALTQLGVLVAVLIVGTPDSVWAARVVVMGLVLALPLPFILPGYRAAVLRPRGPWTLGRKFWAFAIPTGLSGVVGALASNRIEVVILDWFTTPAAMGLFGLAFGLAGHVYAPAQSLIGPLVPAVSGLSRVDESIVRRAFLRTSRVSSAIGGALVSAALVPLAVLVPLIYGDEFSEASDHLILLAVASGATLIGSPHQAFLLARLGGGRMLFISVASLLVKLGLAFALIPVIGVWGATICCAAAMVVRVMLVSSGEARALAIPRGVLLRSLGGLFVGAAIAVALWLLARSIDMPPVWLATLASCLGGVSYLGALRALRVGMSGGDATAIIGALPVRLQRIVQPCLNQVARYHGPQS